MAPEAPRDEVVADAVAARRVALSVEDNPWIADVCIGDMRCEPREEPSCGRRTTLVYRNSAEQNYSRSEHRPEIKNARK